MSAVIMVITIVYFLMKEYGKTLLDEDLDREGESGR